MQKQTLKILLTSLLGLAIIVPNALASYEISDGSVKALYHLEDASDASGNSHTATGVNTPTYVAGKLGNAVSLNGTNQYLTIPDSADFKPAGAFTVSAWLYWSGADQDCFFSSASIVSGVYYGIMMQTKNNGSWKQNTVYCQGSGTNYKDIYASSAFPTSAWHYVTYEYDGSALRIFEDAVLATTSIMTYNAGFNATNYVRIGDYNFGGEGGYWQGKIDELAFFNTAIGTTTRDALYNSGNGQEICTTAGCAATTSTSTSLSTSTDCNIGTDSVDWTLIQKAVEYIFYLLLSVLILSLAIVFLFGFFKRRK